MLRIFYPFMGDTVGGSHLSDLEIISGLDREEFDPIIGTHTTKGILDAYLPDDGTEIHSLIEIDIPRNFKDILKNPLKLFRSIYRATKFLRKNKIDIIHCNDGPLRYVWFYAALATGTKFILMQRGFATKNWEKKISYKLVDGIICNSHFTLENLPAKPNNGKIVVSYPPVMKNPDILQKKAFFRKKLKDELGVSEETKLIGYIANMREWKKPEAFIETAYQLQQDYPASRGFILLGAFYGEYEEKLKFMIKQRNLENSVSFLGFKSNNLEYLAGFDMIVATALNEPFGRVLVEAMNLNVPVVASYSGGHREIINHEETGLFAEPDNVADFTRQILVLENDEILQKKIVIQAQEAAKTKFAPQRQLKAISDFYRQI